jgi:hypothetical protein
MKHASLVLALSLATGASALAPSAHANSCGLPDSWGDVSDAVTTYDLSGKKKTYKSLPKVVKQQVIAGARTFDDGAKITTIEQAVKALREASEGEEVYVVKASFGAKRYSVIRYYGGGNPTGFIFSWNTTTLVAQISDDDIVCNKAQAAANAAHSTRFPASVEGGIQAVTDEDSRKDVAQVTAHYDVKIKGYNASAQIVSIYEGSIRSPFGQYLSIWDAEPQDGGDFGTMQTFHLGRFASDLKVISAKATKIKDELKLTVVFSGKHWNPDTDKDYTVKQEFTVMVSAGVVAKLANVETIK